MEHPPSEDKNLLAMQYFHSGIENFFEGLTTEAKSNLLLALQIDSSLIFAYCYLSSIYCESGEVDKGIDICRQGLALQPTNSYLHFCLGLAYNQKRMYLEAIQEFLIYHRQYSDDAECLFMIASTYDELGNVDLSKQYYHSTLTADPLHYRSYFNLALLEEKSSNFKPAIELFKQVVSIRSDYWKAWVRLGILYFKEQQLEQAIHAYLQALKYTPDLIDVHYNLGISYRLLNQPKQAIPSFKTVIHKNSEDADAWYNLGMAYLDLRDYPFAKEAMLKAINIKLEHPEAHYRLGYIYLLLGEYERAQKELDFLQAMQSTYGPLLKELFKVFHSPQPPPENA